MTVIYACTTLGCLCFFPGVFLSSRVNGACPVTTDLTRRVNARTTMTTTRTRRIQSKRAVFDWRNPTQQEMA